MRGVWSIGRRATAAAVVLAVAVAGACGGDEDLPPSTRRCDLGRSNDQGVVGHDLAASTRLEDGRALFVFGDTLLGTIEDGVRRAGGILNSTGATLPAGVGLCEQPLEYLTGRDGNVRALLPPPGKEGTVFWPIDVAPLDGQVWMLYRWVERTGDGPLELAVLGTGLAVADAEDLEFTGAEQLLVEGDEPLPTSLVADDGELVALVCPGGDDDDGDCRLHPVDTEEVRLGDALGVPEVGLAAAEMSLGRPAGAEGWRVASMPDLGCRLRLAELGDDGEWDERTILAPDVDDDLLCYAGRIQEAFSTEDDLVVTWVDTGGDTADADTYWPHVEEVDLSEEE